MKRSRGYSLVEMLAVMTCASVLLVIATQVVARAMHINSNWRTQGDIARSFSRLSGDLRRDVHQARSVGIAQEPLSLEITGIDGGHTTYMSAEREIVRVCDSGDKQPQREYYKMLQNHNVTIARLTSPDRVELRISQDPKVFNEPARIVLQISAEVGRWSRLTQAGEGSDE